VLHWDDSVLHWDDSVLHWDDSVLHWDDSVLHWDDGVLQCIRIVGQDEWLASSSFHDLWESLTLILALAVR